MPPNWPRDLSEIGRGLQNESLMVWYRVAAFPWFKKLYGRPLVDEVRSSSLPAGDYVITLTYSILIMLHELVKKTIFFFFLVLLFLELVLDLTLAW